MISMTGFAGPIKAWHGSPHDFDQFMMEKIGTGEGNQIYGHGLYFAENKNVAKDYQDKLSGNSPMTKTFGGKDYNLTMDKKDLSKELWKSGYDKEAALAAIEELRRTGGDINATLKWVNGEYSGFSPEAKESISKILSSLSDLKKGKLYQVEIGTEKDNLLDWDKSLINQPEPVMDAIDKIVGKKPMSYLENVGGSDLYESFGVPVGPKSDSLDQKLDFRDATKRFNDAGIPGLKYLDAGSRFRNGGTSNLVIWQPELIKILAKYGMIPPVMGTGLDQYVNGVLNAAPNGSTESQPANQSP
jgi:hypothetical protein